MPAEHRGEQSLLDTAVGALTQTSTATLEASHELLAHYSDTGDAHTQRVVNTLIDHAADALRALTDSLTAISSELTAAPLQAALPRAVTVQAGTFRHPCAEGSPARPRPRRDDQA